MEPVLVTLPKMTEAMMDDVDESLEIDGEQLLTTEQAASFLNRPQRTLEDWRYTGSGPPFVKMGRAVRYRASDLLEWVDDRVVESTTEADVDGAAE
jgi:excisionase family DNA binding protein